MENLTESAAVIARPVIKDGVVYIGACETYFYALNLYNGHLLWSYKTGGIIMGSAAVHNDVIYFGCFDTYLYAISRDGNLLWKFKAGGMIAGAPAIHDGMIYFGSNDNYFYVFSLETHEVIWKFRAGDEIICDPLIDEDKISEPLLGRDSRGALINTGKPALKEVLYFGSQDGYFYCLDLNGTLAWKFKTCGSILEGMPVVTDEAIFFASSDQNIYAVNKRDGTFVWGFRTGDMAFNFPFAFENSVCIGSRDRYFYVLDQKTGTLKWKFQSTDRIGCNPILYNGLLIFGSNNVYALDKNGSLAWSFSQPLYFMCDGVAADEGVVVVTSEAGYVYGLDATTGKCIWKFKTKSTATPKFARVIAPPKWDPTLFEKLDSSAQEKIKKFEPYTFNKFDAGFFEKEKEKRYVIGDEIEGVGAYKSLEKDPSAYIGTRAEEKRRKKELEQIERQFFGR